MKKMIRRIKNFYMDSIRKNPFILLPPCSLPSADMINSFLEMRNADK